MQLPRSIASSADDSTHRHMRMADVVIAEFAKPTDAMIDAAYEAVRFDEAWAINSRPATHAICKAHLRGVAAAGALGDTPITELAAESRPC